jgi:DNA-binding NtrC family response regulator
MKRAKILIADDERSIVEGLRAILSDEGYDVAVAFDGQKALDMLSEDGFGVVLADLKMPKLDGLAILKQLQQKGIPTECIIVTGQATVDSAVQAMREGAYDYVEKPLNADKLNRLKALIPKALEKFNVQQKNRELSSKLEGLTHFGELTGQSEEMRHVYQVIDAVAPSVASVLILGESGTGKELVARAMHSKSDRAKGPFLRTQLRRASQGHSRERAVRTRKGRLHRIDQRESRRIRDGPWRYDLPGRSRRDAD